MKNIYGENRMEITDDFFANLKELQSILVEKYNIEAKKSEAPKQLDAQKELLSRLKKTYITKSGEYDSIKDKVAKIKFELDEAIKSRESGEQGMDNITTHREYEALEKQVNEAKAREADLRKDLQKEEKTLAELKEDLKLQEDSISSQENEVNQTESSLNNLLTDYENTLNELSTKEKDLSKDLPSEILFKFQRIIQRNTEGIVSVKDNICNGCNMILPAQFANEVRDGDKILFCPYCSRILFYQESDDSEDYYTMTETGSLAGDDFDDDENINEDEEYSEEKDYDNSSEFDSDDESEDEEEDSEEEDSDEN